MRQEFTVQAKTVQEAYTKAQEIYGVLGEIISHEVINQGKKGFLGIGRVLAEIKVVIDDGKAEPKPQKEQKPQIAEEKKHQANNNNKQNKKHENKKQDKPQPKPAEKVVNKEPKAETKIETKEEKEENINVTVEEKTLAIGFLKDFVKNIGFNCTVEGDLTPNEKGFVSRLITIEGPDAPSLIGHRGDTLDALQYLANLCLARKSEGEHKEYVKVIIDIENYREKREQTLRALARRMAEKALKYQRNVPLEPMNPYERMIIHSELQAIEGVSTHSVGYDDNRKIVITYERKKKNK